ncbi:MAG: PQQ-binding-like beta-propeller repeat protein [Verrucomicrobia bacterium]|nr:PQQ-binding-like beta-propeller repeat protein [Verrucomicrobiota bacterium]
MSKSFCWLPAVASLVLLAGHCAAAPALDDLPPIRVAAADWPWWRGPKLDNIAPAPQTPPTRWSATENVLWKSDVPGRGHGSPAIWGERIFLPTADETAETQFVLCFDRRSGRKLWQTELHRGGFPKKHSKNSFASPTPACDGERVFLPFVAENGFWLASLDMDGKVVWKNRLGDFHSMHGYGASPVFYKSSVIVVADHVKGSFIAALHRRTGEVVWRASRDDYRLGTYASPSVGRVAGREQLFIQGPFKVFSYDPASGKLLWTCDGPSESTCSNISFDDERVYACAGFPKRNFLCIRADGSGDVTKTHVVWRRDGNCAYVPSLLLTDGLLYMAVDEGKLVCFEAKTGKVVWEDKVRGKFSASPVLAGGHIYLASEAGVTFVFKAGRQFELAAENDLADGGFATPVVLGGRIYLRTLHHLYCIGKP